MAWTMGEAPPSPLGQIGAVHTQAAAQMWEGAFNRESEERQGRLQSHTQALNIAAENRREMARLNVAKRLAQQQLGMEMVKTTIGAGLQSRELDLKEDLLQIEERMTGLTAKNLGLEFQVKEADLAATRQGLQQQKEADTLIKQLTSGERTVESLTPGEKITLVQAKGVPATEVGGILSPQKQVELRGTESELRVAEGTEQSRISAAGSQAGLLETRAGVEKELAPITVESAKAELRAKSIGERILVLEEEYKKTGNEQAKEDLAKAKDERQFLTDTKELRKNLLEQDYKKGILDLRKAAKEDKVAEHRMALELNGQLSLEQKAGLVANMMPILAQPLEPGDRETVMSILAPLVHDLKNSKAFDMKQIEFPEGVEKELKEKIGIQMSEKEAEEAFSNRTGTSGIYAATDLKPPAKTTEARAQRILEKSKTAPNPDAFFDNLERQLTENIQDQQVNKQRDADFDLLTWVRKHRGKSLPRKENKVPHIEKAPGTPYTPRGQNMAIYRYQITYPDQEKK